MASSGTYTYSPAFDDIIVEAWERCGKHEESMDGGKLRSAKRSLQLAMIDWTARGLNLWQVDLVTAVLVAGTATVATAYPTVDVLDVYVTITAGNDRTLAPISRDEYAAITNKTTQSVPTQYWSERANPAPILHLYPVPDSGYTLSYHRIRMPQDVSLFTQTPDAPVLWTEALIAELAQRLAVKFAPERLGVLQGEAARTFANASGENRERVPLTIMPALDGY